MRTLIVTTLVWLSAATLQAQEDSAASKRFGDAGVLMPRGSISLSVASTSPPGEGDGTLTTSVVFAPGIMVFITDGFALGGSLFSSSSSSSTGEFESSSSAVGLSFGLGFDVAFSDRVSWFIEGGLTFSRNAYESGTGTESSSLNSGVYVDAPVLFHFGNFFMGVGPELRLDILAKDIDADGNSEDDSKTTIFGVATTLGGWI